MLNWNGQPILAYLSCRTGEQLDKIYSSPAVSFAIFRLLPELSQLLILKSMWLRDPVYRRAYLKATHVGQYRASKLFVVTNCDEKIRKSANKDLGKKAIERWECILYYLALPSQKSEQGVSGTTKLLFRSAGLTSSNNGDEYMEITSAGFQFLLLSRTEQIWTYLLHYFCMQETDGNDIIIKLDFLFRLTLFSGCTYSVAKFSSASFSRDRLSSSKAFMIDENWPESIKDFLMHLRELGLIFIRKRKDGFFFLTPLLNHLASSFCASKTSLEKRNQHGFVIVETNYRVYAYTDSNLQLAILSTFTEMLYRFNDMCVGLLSREAVRRAFQVGITATQIISYLRANAHPSVLTTNSGKIIESVPITVTDQIQLWEDEKQRLTFSDAAVYSSFDSEEEYFTLKEYVFCCGRTVLRS
ncbi:unnamed protein product [Thelazia callipaeda]|uniref:General transcription factor IIH subunit 4 n=1 Tax=Thelazia callipaeda TaxID=103827 RepID=A0A0N5CYH8_THECL|nr:unnamed protein product [Thelazia callipaeda]